MFNVLIRADASVKMGTGHVMRCLALANAMKKAGVKIFFAYSECPCLIIDKIKDYSDVVRMISARAGTISDAEETAKFAIKQKALWVVTDGYHFKGKYQKVIKDAGLRLLFVDDYGHCSKYYADIILNQNLYARPDLYSRISPFTRLLLGTEYALLRPDFLVYKNWKRKISENPRKVLVSFGGSDPGNTTLKIIKIFKRLDYEVKVVVGGANPRIQLIEKECSQFSNLQVLKNVSNMSELMWWADMVFTSGGTSCWEACFMGLPNIIIYSAENQKLVARSLASIGVALNLGANKDVSAKKILTAFRKLANSIRRREEMSEKARKIVDGLGAERVISAMCLPILREAKEDDCRFVWELSNSKEVREASFSQEPIPWELHKNWYSRMIKNKNSYFFIAESSDGMPIGQVRFNICGRDATISTSILRDFRGRGYGKILIADGSEALFRVSKVSNIHAYIKRENSSSIKAFLKSGYCRVAPDNFAKERKCLHLIKKRVDRK